MNTMPFETFWNWMVEHPNCIVRIGTAEAVLYDDDDLHWYLGPETAASPDDGRNEEGEPSLNALLAQVIRGKRLVGELLIRPDWVAYVVDLGEEQPGQHVFELIREDASERIALYHVVMTHGFTEEDGESHTAVH